MNKDKKVIDRIKSIKSKHPIKLTKFDLSIIISLGGFMFIFIACIYVFGIGNKGEPISRSSTVISIIFTVLGLVCLLIGIILGSMAPQFTKKESNLVPSPIINSDSLQNQENKDAPQQPTTIHGIQVLFALNANAIKALETKGIGWQNAVCYFMAQKGSPNELSISSTNVFLSKESEARCSTTPIYKDKNGVIYVLFSALDSAACTKDELTLLGTIEPKTYAAALCARFNIAGK